MHKDHKIAVAVLAATLIGFTTLGATAGRKKQNVRNFPKVNAALIVVTSDRNGILTHETTPWTGFRRCQQAADAYNALAAEIEGYAEDSGWGKGRTLTARCGRTSIVRE